MRITLYTSPGLKALFRPMTVMVPDLVLICENMLMAEGFIEAKVHASVLKSDCGGTCGNNGCCRKFIIPRYAWLSHEPF